MQKIESDSSLVGVLFLVAVCSFVGYLFYSKGMFKLPLKDHNVKTYRRAISLTLLTCLVVFCVCFFLSSFVQPYLSWYLAQQLQLPVESISSLLLTNMMTMSFTLLFMLFIISKNKDLWSIIIGEKSFFTVALPAASFWLLCFPTTLLLHQLSFLLFSFLGYIPGPEQVAVQELDKLLDVPVLFAFTSLYIVTITPLSEELFFRGLLMNWLASLSTNLSSSAAAKRSPSTNPPRRLNRWLAIVFSSLLFGLAHYSPEQAASNLQLIPILFVVGLFFGFVYERYRSLWASFALHSLFNAISLFMLVMRSES